MRLLQRLGHDIAEGEVEPLAVVLPSLLGEHRQHALDRVLPDGALVAEAAVERVQFGDRAGLADPHLDATSADEVERGDALGDTRRMVRRELDDPVSETDVLRPLACRGEEDLGGRGVRVLLEEVVLDLPGVVEPQPVGELDLVERVLHELVLGVCLPRSRQLQLVEDAELQQDLPQVGLPTSVPLLRARAFLPIPQPVARHGAGVARAPFAVGSRHAGRCRHRGCGLHRPLDCVLPAPRRPDPSHRDPRIGDRGLRGLGAQRWMVLRVVRRRTVALGPRARAARGPRDAASNAGHGRRSRQGERGGRHRLPLREGRHDAVRDPARRTSSA